MRRPKRSITAPRSAAVGVILAALAMAWGSSAPARPQAEPAPIVGGAEPSNAPTPVAGPGAPTLQAPSPPRVDVTGPIRPADAGPRPVEQAPEIFYLPDGGGRLVPVPGFQYRDFLELLGLRDRLPAVPRPPGVVIERLVVEARPLKRDGGDVGAVEITLEIRQMRDGWVDVPLRLGGVILTADPRVEGPGRFILEGPRSDDRAAPSGYRGWVSGSLDDRHTVTMAGVVALEALGDRETFVLDLPVATSSRCVIRTPRTDPVITVQPPGVPPRVEPDDEGGTRIVCEGIGGETRFRIAGRGDAVAGVGILPQVAVESLVRIDGRVAVIDATVRIEGLPTGRGAVRLALPPQCTLVAVREPASLVDSSTEPAGGGEDAATIEIDVAQDGDGVAVVELRCERPIDPTGRTPFDPLGFVVEGVPGWRQRGRTSLVVAGEWQLDWDDPGANRRVDPVPAARQPGFVAAFAHDAQPASLPMRIRPRSSRVVIEPEYRYTIGAARVVMEAKLRLSVRGAPVTRLTVGLADWTIDEVSPATLVDAAAIASRDGEIVIPFLQPLVGDAVVEWRAVLPVDRSGDRLAWTMPQPRADVVGPATVTVGADADIEVVPDAERIRGLLRQVVPASRRDAVDGGQLVYRLDGVVGEFEATRRSLPRRVDAAVDVRATVGERETFVEETLRLDVAHLPLESIDVLLPSAVAAAGDFEIRQGAQVLAPFELPGGEPSTSEEVGTPLRSLLPLPLLGTGEIVLRWTVPTPPPQGDGEVSELALVLPRGVRIGRQSFTLVAEDSAIVDVRGEVWKRDAGAVGSAERTWVATRIQESVPLTLSTPPGSGDGDTVVEAAWLETRLLADRREDRFRYAVTTTSRRLTAAIPTTALPVRDGKPDVAAVDVRLDGRPIRGPVRPDGTVVIDVPQGAGSRGSRASVVVSIGVSRPRSVAGGGGSTWLVGGVVGPLRLEAPRFPDGTIERRFFWELILDDDEHVLAGPARWTPQQRWEWWALGMRRVPIVSRGVLADWVAATARSAAPRPAAVEPWVSVDPGRTNVPPEPPVVSGRVVFAGTGAPGSGTVWLLPTWLLVLVVSGPLLALGLAMVYRPAWRRVPAVFALVLPATLAAVALPSIAPLLVQASIPGCLLTVLAAVLRRATMPAGPAPASPPPGHEDSTRYAPHPSLIVNLDSRSDAGPTSPGDEP